MTLSWYILGLCIDTAIGAPESVNYLSVLVKESVDHGPLACVAKATSIAHRSNIKFLMDGLDITGTCGQALHT